MKPAGSTQPSFATLHCAPFQTVVLLLYAQMVLVTVVVLPWLGFSVHVPVYTALTLLALISHCRAQFTNPGAVPWEMKVSRLIDRRGE
jgi:hypothetical protein